MANGEVGGCCPWDMWMQFGGAGWDILHVAMFRAELLRSEYLTFQILLGRYSCQSNGIDHVIFNSLLS